MTQKSIIPLNSDDIFCSKKMSFLSKKLPPKINHLSGSTKILFSASKSCFFVSEKKTAGQSLTVCYSRAVVLRLFCFFSFSSFHLFRHFRLEQTGGNVEREIKYLTCFTISDKIFNLGPSCLKMAPIDLK